MWRVAGGAGLLMVATGVALAACRAPSSVIAGGGGITARTDRIGWMTKKVVAKQEPEALLAEDGTACRVAPDRFRDTPEGALVYCNWQ